MTSRPNAADPDLSERYDLADSVPSPIAKRYSEWLGARSVSEHLPPRRSAGRSRRSLLRHFLVLHDAALGRLDILEFDDRDAAMAAYGALEHEQDGRRDLEIALLGAGSLDTIRKTHGHYFSHRETRLPRVAAGTR